MGSIAIIPARSGSKGVADKNIKLLSGKPLLQYSVEAAINSNIFNCVHVSTDSEKYAETARDCGADVPFLRCQEFASDIADSWSVVRFVLEQYQQLGRTFDMVTLLQPTSPLRDANDIKSAYSLFCEKEAEVVISVSEVEHSPLLMNTLDVTLSLNGFINLKEVGRRQNMPQYYQINGAIYMMKTYILDRISDLYGERSYAYIMPREKSIDIDSMIDFKVAEIILEESVEVK
ncbi:MAG: acylneuraminate cytidylyltransferase family protein [Lachnospiraceae bacterium]|nr:acylneuraminate cytidylyltransferase family protein [Lachnospiraceae bacterium]